MKGKSSLTLKEVYASNLKKRYSGLNGQNSKYVPRVTHFGQTGEPKMFHLI